MTDKYGPIPYVKSLSYSGELTIGWYQQLVVPEKPKDVESLQVIIERMREVERANDIGNTRSLAH